MIIYTKIPKSKKRKRNAKKRALASSWQEILKEHQVGPFATKKSLLTNKLTIKSPWAESRRLIEPERDPKTYPSIDTGYHNTAKKSPMFYTGDKMIGIGTLHKSNAVPIFNVEEAKDMANMRR